MAKIEFTPLLGANDDGPLCYLLEIDGYKLLLDCGWTATFDETLLKPLKRLAPVIDAVLISHPDLAHLGALAYLYGPLNVKVPIFMTIPVCKMGPLVLYDAWNAVNMQRDVKSFTLDDIDAVFNHATQTQLKYSQHYSLSGKGHGITLVPYQAGHLVGGTVWKIKKETDEIVYAVDYNHKKEQHLNPTILETLSKPSLLITDAYNTNTVAANLKQRDKDFFEAVLATLRKGGDVLIPTDASGRALEFVVAIEQYWAYYKFQYPVLMLSAVATTTIETAKSMLEWMSDAILKKFETRENQFNLKFVTPCQSREELTKYPGPRVILASSLDLTAGYGLDLFLEFSADAKNLVVIPDRGMPNTIQRTLSSRPTHLSFDTIKRVPLDGEELEAYQAEERAKKEAEQEAARLEQEKKRSETAARIHDYEGEDVALANSLHTLWLESYDFKASQIDLLKKHHLHPMYPYAENRAVFDDYGEIVRLEEFNVGAEMTEASYRFAFGGSDEKLVNDMDVDKAAPQQAVVPTKSIVVTENVDVKCGVQYYDFEGRSDGRSMKKILQHVAPKKIVLIHGAAEAIEVMREFCTQNLKQNSTEVFTTNKLQSLDLTSDTNLFRISLADGLLDSLNLIKVGQYELARVTGIATREELKLAKAHEAEQNPTLLGDVRLAEFRQLLLNNNFKAEFQKGALVVNDFISVRKEEGEEGTSKLNVDGPLCEDYFRVRELLYSNLTVL